MGCASSAALPFLTNRGNQAVAESPRLNGKPPYELKMVNNKLKENGLSNVKDVNETYVSEKMKEVADSSAVQEVIGGVVQTKDEIVNQVKGFGDEVSEKVTSVVNGVEDTIESAFGKLTNAVGSIKSEVTSIEENVKTVIGSGEEKINEMKSDDIDDLLESLPTEEEMKEAVKTAAEEVVEKAEDETKEDRDN